jgi:hypothetical protein
MEMAAMSSPPKPRSPEPHRPGSGEVDPRKVRDVFAARDYTDGAILAQLGVDNLTQLRETDLDQILERTKGGSPLETLVRLFLAGAPASRESVARAVAPMRVEEWLGAGLLEAAGDGELRGALRVLPYFELLMAFDRPERARSAHEADYVMGIGRSTLTLANLTVRRPSRATLDLGTGCGILAFLAAPHSERVLAVDRNPRAIAIADWNARANGLDHVECRAGDLFAPVEGLRFDLVVTNPPFVISPATGYIYRDSGLAGDEITQRILREVPDFLEEGGFCHVLCNWAHFRGQDWRERLAAWFEGTGCDTYVLRSESSDAATYAATWIRHTEGDDPERHRRLFAEWMAYYGRLGIEGMGAGMIAVRRRAGRNWLRFEEAPEKMIGPCGDALLRIFGNLDFLHALPAGEPGDRILLEQRLRVNPELRLDQVLAPGEEGWTPVSTGLRLAKGLGWKADADPVTARLLASCDGRHPVGPLLAALARSIGASPSDLTRGALPLIRGMMERGILVSEGPVDGDWNAA